MKTRFQAFLAAWRFPSVDGADWGHDALQHQLEQDYLNTARDLANLEQRQRQISLGFLRRQVQA